MNSYKVSSIIADIRIPRMNGLEIVSKKKGINSVKVFLIMDFNLNLNPILQPELDSLGEIIQIFQNPLSMTDMSKIVIRYLQTRT